MWVYKECANSAVLVSTGCYNKIHRLVDLNNRNLFLIVLGAEKSKIKVLVYLVPGEASLLSLQKAIFWLCPHMGREIAVTSLLPRALIHHEGSTLIIYLTSKDPTRKYCHTGIRSSTRGFGGDISVHSIYQSEGVISSTLCIHHLCNPSTRHIA